MGKLKNKAGGAKIVIVRAGLRIHKGAANRETPLGFVMIYNHHIDSGGLDFADPNGSGRSAIQRYHQFWSMHRHAPLNAFFGQAVSLLESERQKRPDLGAKG